MTATVDYGTSQLNGEKPKRYRSTKAQLAEIDNAIMEIAGAEYPISVRGIFYPMVSPYGLVPKSDKRNKLTGEPSGYGIVQRRVLKLRRDGILPYGWITDGTRLRLKPNTYDSADEALIQTARAYRRALWTDQDVYVEVWTEKDTIRGVLYPVTAEFDVPLLIARGQPSETFTYEAAEEINDIGKPAFIYQLGDHDKAGVDAWEATKRKLRGFVNPDIDLRFERLAVTPQQIDEHQLLTRPDKTNSGFGPCVEVDAIPSTILRQLVRDAIEQHIDPEALRLTRIAEESEREVLLRIANDGWEDPEVSRMSGWVL